MVSNDELIILELLITGIFTVGLDKERSSKVKTEENLLSLPKSRLEVLLRHSTQQADEFSLNASDRQYLEGWQHCLMVCLGNEFIKYTH